MKTLERVMQVMTHVNIGCALGMVAWVVWSGFQIMGGHSTPPQYRPSATAAVTHQHHPAHNPGPARSIPAQPACCLSVDPHADHGHSHDPAPQLPETQLLLRPITDPGPASRGVRI
jgi:hypothetical protein